MEAPRSSCGQLLLPVLSRTSRKVPLANSVVVQVHLRGGRRTCREPRGGMRRPEGRAVFQHASCSARHAAPTAQQQLKPGRQGGGNGDAAPCPLHPGSCTAPPLPRQHPPASRQREHADGGASDNQARIALALVVHTRAEGRQGEGACTQPGGRSAKRSLARGLAPPHRRRFGHGRRWRCRGPCRCLLPQRPAARTFNHNRRGVVGVGPVPCGRAQGAGG